MFWNEIKKSDFFQSLYNSVLYFNSQSTYVAVYIDDLYTIEPDLSLMNELKTQLVSKFKITDLGPMANYLGIEISQEKDTIIVTQIVYID